MLLTTPSDSQIFRVQRAAAAAARRYIYIQNSYFSDKVFIRDLVMARREDRIVGVLGLWDQSGYKQTVVQSYADPLRRARPLYNLAARLTGIQPLPGKGQHIRSAYASFVCVEHDDPGIFAALLREVTRLAATRGYAYLMLGLAERDPLLPTARGYPHIAYHSTLYVAGVTSLISR